MDRVRIADWPAEVAVDRGEDGPKSRIGYGGAQAEPLEVGNATGFKPTKINRVIHVAEGVLVAPLHGPGNDDRKVDERSFWMRIMHMKESAEFFASSIFQWNRRRVFGAVMPWFSKPRRGGLFIETRVLVHRFFVFQRRGVDGAVITKLSTDMRSRSRLPMRRAAEKQKIVYLGGRVSINRPPLRGLPERRTPRTSYSTEIVE